MPKQRCIKIYRNNTFDEKFFSLQANMTIKDGKDEVKYTPLCKLTENKPKRKFWRGRKSIIVFVEDALNALHFDEPKETMQLAWGKAESREFLFKLNAMAELAVKPLKTWQFLVIMLMLGILIIVGVMNLQKLAVLGL